MNTTADPSSVRESAAAFRRTAAAGLLIVLAGIAAYANSFHVPFVLDDVASIPENSAIRHLWPPWPMLFEGRTPTVVGRPMLNLSLAINYALGGDDVWGYHAANLALHLAAALTLFGVVRRTLALPAMPRHVTSASTPLALAIALLWTLHPLQTESVTYIVQRAESLAGLFYLLTLYGLIRGAASARPRGWHAAAVTACALGMASKEIVVSAPLVALLYDRVFLAGAFKEALRRRWRLYAGLAATWGLLAALVASATTREGSAGFGLGMTWWEYARTQFGYIIHYLRLTFWPDVLVLDYGTETASAAAEIVPHAIAIALLLAGTVLALRRWPWAGFLGAWFFAILAPTSSVVPLVGQTAAEHRMYLPLAAAIALVVVLAYEGWTRLLGRWPAARGRALWLVPVVALGAAAAALGHQTYRRNLDYRSVQAIWEDTLAKRPRNVRAYVGLGVTYATAGDIPRAIELYNIAVTLAPRHADTYYNRGLAFRDAGRIDQAIEDFTKVISLQPGNSRAYVGLGASYSTSGNLARAIDLFNKAITLAPGHADAYYNRGVAFQDAGHIDQAIEDFTRAISLQPRLARAYNNRGLAYQARGRTGEALQDFTQAIEAKPDFAEAYCNRGVFYKAQGRLREAVQDYDRAIELKPDFAEAYNNRGNALRLMGRTEPAARDFTQAIALKPDYGAAYFNRAVTYFMLKQYDRAWADVRACKRLGLVPDPEFIRNLGQASGRTE